MGIRDFVFTLDDSVAVNEEEQEVVKVSKSTAIVRKKADDDIQSNFLFSMISDIDNVKPKEVPQTELKDETPAELVNSIDEEESSDESVQDPENDHISDMNVVINDDSDSEDKVVDLRKKNFFADDKKEEILYDSFTEMSLSRPLIKGLTDMGFMTPTKIQAMAIPVGLAGRDLCAAASTGSGKSGYFISIYIVYFLGLSWFP